MDHHCPWINNCVGFGNYPHFFRFVFFVNLTCGYALILLFWRIYIVLDTTHIVSVIYIFKEKKGKNDQSVLFNPIYI